jgi:glyoxylase-like metal-dependent hydrolase (beta-lactamase superfamily II)
MPSLTLGSFELSIIPDGTYPLDGGAFFGVIPKIMWSRKVHADERNYVQAGLNSLLIRTGKQNVLVETGMGNKLSDRMVKFYGQPAQLLTNLAAAGIAPEDIDIVINTHLHFDHCGWNTIKKDGKIVPTFPRAKYYAPEGEWQYARKPSDRDAISYIPDNYDPLVKSGQMTLLKGGEEILPGITVKTFPGHTAHMQAVIVDGSGGKATDGKGMNANNVEAKGTDGKGMDGNNVEAKATDGKGMDANNVEAKATDGKGMNANNVEAKGTDGKGMDGKGTTSVVPLRAESSAALAAEGSVACYISDLIPTAAHIDLTWGMGFDLYPLETIESKKQYYAKAIPEKWLTVFTHDAKNPWAYVEKDDVGKMVVRGVGDL